MQEDGYYMNDDFKAYVVREDQKGKFSANIETKKFDELPPHEILSLIHI